jgi:hypothetical protein
MAGSMSGRRRPRSSTFRRRTRSSLAARNSARSASSGGCGAIRRGRRAVLVASNTAMGRDRSRLKGDEGREAWSEWGILAYDAATL